MERGGLKGGGTQGTSHGKGRAQKISRPERLSETKAICIDTNLMDFKDRNADGTDILLQ